MGFNYSRDMKTFRVVLGSLAIIPVDYWYEEIYNVIIGRLDISDPAGI